MTEETPAPVAVQAATRFTLLPGHVRIERNGAVREVPLDDPADPVFLSLPTADLGDGRSLRRAAFDAWADHLRAAVAAGRDFETTYRAPRPFATALAIGGATFVAGLGTALLSSWALRPVPAVDVRPGVAESFAIVFAVAVVVSIIVLAVAALLRAWRCRRGSYLHLSAYGLRTSQGGRAEPLSNVAAADWHALVRCTRVVFANGRADLWLPAEPGALRRMDLICAALDDRLGEVLRQRL